MGPLCPNHCVWAKGYLDPTPAQVAFTIGPNPSLKMKPQSRPVGLKGGGRVFGPYPGFHPEHHPGIAKKRRPDNKFEHYRIGYKLSIQPNTLISIIT